MLKSLKDNGIIDNETAFLLYDCSKNIVYISEEASTILHIKKDDLRCNDIGNYLTYKVIHKKYVDKSSRDSFEKMIGQKEEYYKKYPIKFVNSGTCIVLDGTYVIAKFIYIDKKKYILAQLKVNENWMASCPSVMKKFTTSPFSGLKNKYSLYNSPPEVFENSKIYMILLGNYHLVEREHGENVVTVLKEIINEIIRHTIWDQVYHFEKDKIVIIDNTGINADELYNNLKSLVKTIVGGIDVFISMCSISNDAFTYDSISKFFYVVDIFVSNTSLNSRSKYMHIDKNVYAKYKESDTVNNIVINAVRNKKIGVAYQPQISLKTGKVVGFEALLRPDIYEVPISTAKFISICSNNGLVTNLDTCVLINALDMYNKIKESGYDMDDFMLSVNITPESLPKIDVDELEELVREYNIPNSAVKFELVEEVLIRDKEIEVLRKITDKGFRIALDDFSAGHSSLKYLFKIDPHTVKLDKSLIPDMSNEKEKLVYTFVTDLCKKLGLTTIAEGVETVDELDFMKELGIDKVQGYIYSKALKDEEFIKYIIDNRK